MSHTTRPADAERDLAAMYDLAVERFADALHVADLPWRFAAPGARAPGGGQLWLDESGKLVAWVMVQTAWLAVDYVGPDEIFEPALEWAIHRLRSQEAELWMNVSLRADDAARIETAKRHGFARADWSTLHLSRDISTALPDAGLSPGYTIRPLAGESEAAAAAAAHRAAFGSNRMTTEFRLASIRDPHHVPELDLVAVAPDGALAGFCIGWITPELATEGGARVAQIEPMGVHPAHQRRGIARAMLTEVIRRTREMGAGRILVDSYSNNDAAVRSYKAVGFEVAYEAPAFVRVFNPSPV